MELTFAAATDVGRHREHNEDNFLIDKKLRLFVVADGMGGHAAGDVASSITVHKVRDAVHENRDLISSFGREDSAVESIEILRILEHALQTACSTVYERAQRDRDKRGMGTTASVLLITGATTKPRGFIAHVGDSRIYLARQGQCHQLTEDHSLVNELLRNGKMRKEDIESSPYQKFKNAVTRAVGVYPSVEVDTFDFDILPGDHYLLCSDGTYAYFTEERLPTLLCSDEISDVPGNLIELANNGGGHDNITAVAIRVGTSAPHEDRQQVQNVALKLEVLKAMHFFRYLNYKELVKLVNITRTLDFAQGEDVFREGERGEAMYVVLEGSVEISKNGATLATCETGQHFGEMSLVDRTPRSVSATCADKTQLLAIQRTEFYGLIKTEASLSVKLLWSFVQVLANRLRKTTAELSGVLQQGAPDEPSVDRLFDPHR